MYISICDDQESELQFLIHLLDRWQSERNHALRLKTFNSASAMLDAAEKEPFSLYILDDLPLVDQQLSPAKEFQDLQRKDRYDGYGILLSLQRGSRTLQCRHLCV